MKKVLERLSELEPEFQKLRPGCPEAELDRVSGDLETRWHATLPDAARLFLGKTNGLVWGDLFLYFVAWPGAEPAMLQDASAPTELLEANRDVRRRAPDFEGVVLGELNGALFVWRAKESAYVLVDGSSFDEFERSAELEPLLLEALEMIAGD